MGKVWDVLAPRNLELGPLAGSARGQGQLAQLEARAR